MFISTGQQNNAPGGLATATDTIGHQTAARQSSPLPWIEVVTGQSGFRTEHGQPWTPIGQNDAITWPELNGLFRRKDMATAERYLAMLSQHGVTCLRLMLEYSENRRRYFENPVSHFPPNMVQLWDDLFALCEKHGIRILLTPFDTFWMWIKWERHPYNKLNGGLCDKRSRWLLCKDTRNAIKQRLAFATERWGGSGALFAWDLWNEIHPAHAANSTEVFADFVEDISSFLRGTELRLHGRAHPQTVSVFGPVLQSHPQSAACIFRHPSLDFASTHFYESKTIDYPRNTVDAAISTGRLTAEALSEIKDGRPFFDSEHGPIHCFKDKLKTLPEPFDDEYFRLMQWAHFASGGAGGGMRWPNRHPHSLTAGMRLAQRGLARFLPLIDWQRFSRRCWNDQVNVSNKALAAFACGDEQQAVVWLLRQDSIGKDGMLRRDVEPVSGCIHLPFEKQGDYRLVAWDTTNGKALSTLEIRHDGGSHLCVPLPSIVVDIALAVQAVRG